MRKFYKRNWSHLLGCLGLLALLLGWEQKFIDVARSATVTDLDVRQQLLELGVCPHRDLDVLWLNVGLELSLGLHLLSDGGGTFKQLADNVIKHTGHENTSTMALPLAQSHLAHVPVEACWREDDTSLGLSGSNLLAWVLASTLALL